MNAKLGRAPSLDIEVPQDVIDTATEKDSSHCVVADSLRAHLKIIEAKTGEKFSAISVDLQTIRFSNKTKGERYTYLSPRSCQVCLVNFDQGIKPQPFKFRLRVGQTTTRGSSEKELIAARARKAARTLEEKTLEAKEVQKIKKESAKMRPPVDASGKGWSVPEKVGGKPPPVSVGRRRQFGLRAFDR